VNSKQTCVSGVAAASGQTRHTGTLMFFRISG
jgi:hypothetical protein